VTFQYFANASFTSAGEHRVGTANGPKKAIDELRRNLPLIEIMQTREGLPVTITAVDAADSGFDLKTIKLGVSGIDTCLGVDDAGNTRWLDETLITDAIWQAGVRLHGDKAEEVWALRATCGLDGSMGHTR
jgi:hypothetical protein